MAIFVCLLLFQNTFTQLALYHSGCHFQFEVPFAVKLGGIYEALAILVISLQNDTVSGYQIAVGKHDDVTDC